jgi:hypothetical protein
MGFLPLQLSYNTYITDVDSFSTHTDGTKGQQQRKPKSQGKDADIGYKSAPAIGSRPYKGIHLATHLWTDMDIQCLQRQG